MSDINTKTAKKPVKFPTKKTLNLMVKEKSLASPTRLIPILLLIVVGALAFSKFAVMDRLEKVSREEAELAEMKRQLELIQSAFKDYDEVEAQYTRYSYESFDRTIPDRIDVLEMLEQWFMPVSRIQNIAINGRDLTMTIADISMETVSYLLGVLNYEEPLVEFAKINSYTDQTDREQTGEKTIIATISITLADATNTYRPDALEFDPDAIINEGTPDDNAEEPESDVPEADDTAAEGDEQVGDGTENDNNTVEPESTDDTAPEGTENGGEE